MIQCILIRPVNNLPLEHTVVALFFFISYNIFSLEERILVICVKHYSENGYENGSEFIHCSTFQNIFNELMFFFMLIVAFRDFSLILYFNFI